MTDLDKWAIFLRYAGEPDYRKIVNEVIESKEALQMAGELLMSISQNERERAVFRSRKMYETDLASNLATAEDRGRAEGFIEGELKGKLKVAQNLRKMNMPLEQIAQMTQLPIAQIASLLE